MTSGAKAAVSFAGNCGFLSRLTCIAGKKSPQQADFSKQRISRSRLSKQRLSRKELRGATALRAVIHVGVCKFHQTGILNRGSGGQGQLDVGFI
ncbi:hypothetical protein [Comamonas antarctica]|uniref:hypothetical protein n=1 Tax=Comamonas antarctica TaxID=2743470 RepID=UPI0028EFDB7F|nr:hypothetical protein [Comamonas antarctica]